MTMTYIHGIYGILEKHTEYITLQKLCLLSSIFRYNCSKSNIGWNSRCWIISMHMFDFTLFIPNMGKTYINFQFFFQRRKLLIQKHVIKRCRVNEILYSDTLNAYLLVCLNSIFSIKFYLLFQSSFRVKFKKKW